MSETVVAADCHAKANLFLRVLAREAGGMHSLETLFCRIGLADRLEVERTGSGIELEVEGADLGPPEQNLAWRAADAVLQATGRQFGVRLRLVKRSPHGAGLGGGSSNAAAALACVNQLARSAVPRAELFHMAARLGADVPFFLSGAPLALGWGHGTRLLELPPLDPRPMLLLVPHTRIPTASAYQWLDQARYEQHDRGAVSMSLELLGKWSDIARAGGNDFESVIFARHRELHEAFEALARTGPMLCRMSGSGSALFAVYRTERDREDAIGQIGRGYGEVIATGT
ncbi:MAG TPA: 4-(cytidine 5'-diphospho)-2-C-methyl-D-erythritol kinase [Gemmatimonadales bacterium]|nr:4-(cytidine 5'-diphospho)-2-C-methyl-D-erythritol kinase [Gemmatimonadales bacterium]